ncbi:MAG: hypothetical protein JSR26_03965 [Proteobacteria bacterium]|nr:hypothetical protein [Pseudomonadota bacterium]
MSFTVDLWHVIALAITIIGSFAGLVRLLLIQFGKHFDVALKEINADSAKWRELELKFYQHLADLPVSYVRREDYVRGQTVIEAKLDAIATELKAVQMERRQG